MFCACRRRARLDGGGTQPIRGWMTLAPANDVVLSPSIRGNKEDMQKYLDWELTLKH